MREVWEILGAIGDGRAKVARKIASVVALSALAGVTSGSLPAILGVALDTLLHRWTPSPAGLAGYFAHAVSSLSSPEVLVAAIVATLASVAITVVSSQRASATAGEVAAALRVALLRAALHASPHDVEAAGERALNSPNAPKPPPGVVRPAPRGADVVKLAIARDAQTVSDFSLAFVSGLPQALVTLVVLAWELAHGGALAILGGAVLLFVLSRLVADRASKRSAAMQSLQRADTVVFSTLGETLAATEELRLLGARAQAVREFASASYATAGAKRRFAGAVALSGQVKALVSALAPLLLLVLATSGHRGDPGDVAKLLLAIPLLMARLEALDALRTGLMERRPLLVATLDLLRLPAWPASPSSPVAVASLPDASLALDAVHYRPKGAARDVLDGFSLAIPDGALVGVVGRSGSGKSTLLRLLLRLEDFDAGSIRIGGADLRSIDVGELDDLFAVLGQKTLLFERTIAENLALGLDETLDATAIAKALERVDLAELAGGGARGLETRFRAVPPNFSGGEQRRLMLARMLLRDARVLLIDEPEAGLPSATAEQILARIAEVAKGKTCLVVTHAPHLLRSDFNVLVDEGRVVATGKHEELAATNEIYRSLLAEALKS